MAASWATLSTDRVDLAPGESKKANLTIRFPSDAPAGDYAFQLVATAPQPADNVTEFVLLTVSGDRPPRITPVVQTEAEARAEDRLQLLATGVAAIAVVIGAGWLLRRRREGARKV
jgi:hypothetical protein